MHDPATRNQPRRRHAELGGLSYLAQAQACLTAAAAARDPDAQSLYRDECRLWLILAAQRRAIDAMLSRHLAEADAA